MVNRISLFTFGFVLMPGFGGAPVFWGTPDGAISRNRHCAKYNEEERQTELFEKFHSNGIWF